MISLVEPGDTRLGMAPGEPLLLAMVQGLAKTAGPGLRREVWLKRTAPPGLSAGQKGASGPPPPGAPRQRQPPSWQFWGAPPPWWMGGLSPSCLGAGSGGRCWSTEAPSRRKRFSILPPPWGWRTAAPGRGWLRPGKGTRSMQSCTCGSGGGRPGSFWYRTKGEILPPGRRIFWGSATP